MVKKSTKKTEQPTETLETVKENLKNELRSYLDEKLDDRFLDKIEDVNKKLLREKSRKIWFRNILILILLAVLGFETCVLYKEGSFNFLFRQQESTNNLNETSEKSPSSSVLAEEKAPSLSELKEKYTSLLNPFKPSKTSSYLSDFNSGTLSNELKLYFSLNSLEFGDLEIEEDYNLVSTEKLKSAAEKLFSANDLILSSFDYNGNRLRYFEKLNAFVSSELLKKSDAENLVSLEISDIKEEADSKIIIKTENNLLFTFKDKKLVSLSKID